MPLKSGQAPKAQHPRFLLNTPDKTASVPNLHWLQPMLWLGAWLVLFVLAFQDVIQYFISMWVGSSTFTHGFFVLPMALFFAWGMRYQFVGMVPRLSIVGILLLVAAVAVNFLGHVFSVSTVQQLALVGALMASAVAALGWSVALKLWFPLSLLFFLAPLGNELIPLFQSVTADLSVWLLGVTPIPVHHDGLYITIPGHVFEVAEACSGIRFFVTCVFLGYIYAGINFNRLHKRVLFLLFAVALPIMANALRVFGIIVLGHYVDIKYAKGFDHLFVGWVFFFIVSGIMFGVGYLFADPSPKTTIIAAHPSWGRHSWHKTFAWLSLPLVVLLLLYQTINLNADKGEIRAAHDPAAQGHSLDRKPVWSPTLQNPAGTLTFPLRTQQQTLDAFVGWYNDDVPGAKLLDGSNQLYDSKHWSLAGSESVSLEFAQNRIEAKWLTIISPAGQRRFVIYWYEVPGLQSASKIKVKWQQGINKMMNRFRGGQLIAVSAEYGPNQTKESIVASIEDPMASATIKNVTEMPD